FALLRPFQPRRHHHRGRNRRGRRADRGGRPAGRVPHVGPARAGRSLMMTGRLSPALPAEGRKPRTQANRHWARATAPTKGREIVEGLSELAEALRSGEPLESRFTVRRYKIAPPPEYRGADVRRARDRLAMSQAAFAAFLGADASTVRSWEQG